ncbi:HAD hydrolase-like protein [Metabacillus arenae]|uniref:HAD hydrolase-like protein n=1 Tax=Metabacillus arenae TaxID=2771434 RepID=A0A926RZR9_9BACI|nr:HAD hydrolase-like protein [Metabacillus arenae]MBD1383431.1 HAD hydrolase-like protein [Metabacillus arenae]
MIKVVIFDFDGTIVESGQVVFDLFNSFADKYNYTRMPQDQSDYIRTITFKERFKKFNVPFFKIPMLTIDIVKKYKDMIPELQAIENIKFVLQELKRSGFKLILISANSKENIKKFLEMNEMDFFEEILTTHRFFGRHLTLNNYMRTSKLCREEVIFVGDKHRDIVACKKSNIKIISVTWGYDFEVLLTEADPDFIVRKPKEILNIIEKVN